MTAARIVRCNGGRIQVDYDDPRWQWKLWPCDTCDIVVLPYSTKWLDPTWLRWKVPFEIERWAEDRKYR